MLLEHLATGLQTALLPGNLLAALLGTTGGIVVGVLPGLSATMAVALLLPVTYLTGPIAGLIMLSGIYCGAIYGGSISAVLLGTPGTGASVVTSWDGHAMTKRGESKLALATVTWASFFGGILGGLVLIFLSPVLAEFALLFGPADYTALVVFSLTLMVSMSGDQPVKGVMIGLFGALITTVGLDPVYGVPRFTLGSDDLLGGISFIAVLIGVFSIPQALLLASGALKERGVTPVAPVTGSGRLTFRQMRGQALNALRSAGIGIWIGILPGIGPETSPFISYEEAKRYSRHPHRFGTGIIDGLVASEAANNATVGGSLIPLLTLGIPGSAVAAVYVGALTIHGLQPGPMLFAARADVVYSLFVGFLICNLVMLAMGLVAVVLFTKVLGMPKAIVAILIIVFSMVGSYAVRNSIFDLWVTVLSGAIGYVLAQHRFPLGALALGMILGPILEENMLRALALSHDSWLIFVQQPIAVVFLTLAVASLIWSIRKAYLRTSRSMLAAPWADSREPSD